MSLLEVIITAYNNFANLANVTYAKTIAFDRHDNLEPAQQCPAICIITMLYI